MSPAYCPLEVLQYCQSLSFDIQLLHLDVLEIELRYSLSSPSLALYALCSCCDWFARYNGAAGVFLRIVRRMHGLVFTHFTRTKYLKASVQ